MMYIRGITAVIPGEPVPGAAFLAAAEPDYTDTIPAGQLRRMSRIIRMGLWAGRKALEQAGVSMPDAILTATALGANDDTEKFLRSFSGTGTTGSPTPFIQSTHNALGGQLALALQCTSYNMTYTQRGASFESALEDAALLLAEGASAVLCGAAEEMTSFTAELMQRSGIVPPGKIPGEGTVFLVLFAAPSANSLGRITALITERSDAEKFVRRSEELLKSVDLTAENTRLICGDPADAEMMSRLRDFPLVTTDALSGYYPTRSAYGVWRATEIFRQSPDVEHIFLLYRETGGYYRLICLQR